MDSDIILKDNGTVEISGDKLQADVSNMALQYSGGHITSNNGGLEISSDRSLVKTTCTDYALYYRGGHITSNNGSLEISSDSSLLTHGSLAKTTCTNYELYYEGGHIISSANNLDIASSHVKIGTPTEDKFTGIKISQQEVTCNAPAVSVLNPTAPIMDSETRLALMQSAEDALVLNASKHYTGGVRVEGRVVLAHDAVAKGEFKIEKAGKLLLQKPDKVLRGPGGREIVMPDFLNVLDTITALEAKVADLTQRLAKLE